MDTWVTDVVDASEGQRRLLALAAQAGPKTDAILLAQPENIYYFSGFRTTIYTRFTALLVRGDQPLKPILIVATVDQHMIQDKVWSQTWASDIAYYGPDIALTPGAALVPYLQDVQRLGIDALSLTEMEVIREAAPRVELLPIKEQIDGIRLIKSEQELVYLQQANQLAIQGIKTARDLLEAGPATELEVAVRLEADARLAGADGFGYPTLVSCGAKIAALHSPPLTRPIQAHEPIRLAFGPAVQGYTADVVRMLCLETPSTEYVRLQDGYLFARDALIALLYPGTKVSDMLASVEETYTRWGLRDYWGNSIGHSLGLTVHEPPRLVRGSDTILPEGMVVAIEPGLIVPGFGGYWQCDVFVVSDRGPELLTQELQGIAVASGN
jgi:Xaa-Pro aminopeptidase